MTAKRETATAITAIMFVELSSVSLFSNFIVGEVVIADEIVVVLIKIIDRCRKDDEANTRRGAVSISAQH
jgi:hypothetical protein